MRPRRLLLSLLVAALLAGCTSAPLADLDATRTVAADTNPRVSPGYAYGGAGVQPVEGMLQGTFNAEDDTGHGTVDVHVGPDQWVITLDAFSQAPGADFQEGGIAFDLWEHGDTGVSSAGIPKILATVAAWGTATVTVNGEPLADPNSGDERWAAHLMVSDTTVRFDDNLIAKQDGTTPYDPDTPADARREDENPQVVFLIKPASADAPSFNETREEAFEGEGAFTMTAPAVYGGVGEASLTFTSPAAVGEYEVIVRAPSGEEVARETTGFIAGPADDAGVDVTWDAVETGDYEVEVVGEGAGAVRVDLTVTHPPSRGLTLTWDDFTLS